MQLDTLSSLDNTALSHFLRHSRTDTKVFLFRTLVKARIYTEMLRKSSEYKILQYFWMTFHSRSFPAMGQRAYKLTRFKEKKNHKISNFIFRKQVQPESYMIPPSVS